MLIVPHWFLVIVSGCLAVVLKPKPRLRFSLRDLLVAMTMVAVVVAALAALPKTWLTRQTDSRNSLTSAR